MSWNHIPDQLLQDLRRADVAVVIYKDGGQMKMASCPSDILAISVWPAERLKMPGTAIIRGGREAARDLAIPLSDILQLELLVPTRVASEELVALWMRNSTGVLTRLVADKRG